MNPDERFMLHLIFEKIKMILNFFNCHPSLASSTSSLPPPHSPPLFHRLSSTASLPPPLFHLLSSTSSLSSLPPPLFHLRGNRTATGLTDPRPLRCGGSHPPPTSDGQNSRFERARPPAAPLVLSARCATSKRFSPYLPASKSSSSATIRRPSTAASSFSLTGAGFTAACAACT